MSVLRFTVFVVSLSDNNFILNPTLGMDNFPNNLRGSGQWSGKSLKNKYTLHHL